MPSFPKHSAVLSVCALLLICALSSCSPITRHQVLTTIFDGVPSMPPAEQICTEYAAEVLAKDRDEREGKGKVVATAQQASAHKPYSEKRCDDCHDKTTESGFVAKSKTELCFVCHFDFIKGSYVHGPVAVGDCLACHDPHTSVLPSLLKVRSADICAVCHKEQRQALALHTSAATHALVCVNCHSPHYGNVPYFLK